MRLPPVSRQAFLAAAALLLVVLPIGSVTLLLALSVALDLAAAVLLLHRIAPRALGVVGVGRDAHSLALLRRTVPELRMRRPPAVVEVQVRWRQAAATRRQRLRGLS